MTLFFGCEELPDPAGLRGVAVVPGISGLDPGIFDSKDLGTTYIEFTINIPDGSEVEKIVIQGSYKDNQERVPIEEITSFPATIRISCADAAQKIGIDLADISNGDIFIFELATTNDGKTTYSSAVLSIPVACAYDVNLATGSYHVIGGDWGSEGNVTLTADPSDEYKIYVSGLEEIEGLVEDLGPLVMYVDPVTFTVDVPLKAIASDAWGYHDIAYEGNGTYSSCDGSYSMVFTITVVEGTFGTFQFSFTRNP